MIDVMFMIKHGSEARELILNPIGWDRLKGMDDEAIIDVDGVYYFKKTIMKKMSWVNINGVDTAIFEF